MSLTIVMQGPVYQWTDEFIRRYKDNPHVSEVILSTWKDEPLARLIGFNNRIKVIENEKPINPGQGNRNCQIVSSLAGLKAAQSKYVIKVRSDIFLSRLELMLAFFHAYKKNENIFTLSIYPHFPFHPRDHVFFGETKNLIEMFDIPLDEIATPYDEWQDIRSETYIGMYYYRKYDQVVQKYIDNPFEYLTDKSPKRSEALATYHRFIREEKGFVPFPQVQVEFPKHYPGGYPFQHLKNVYGEIYHGEKI